MMYPAISNLGTWESINDTQMLESHIPVQMNLQVFGGAKIVQVVAEVNGTMLLADNGLLYMWYGFQPVLFNPINQPLSNSIGPGRMIVPSPWFGGCWVGNGYRMKRDLASQFARGRFTTNAEYVAYLRSQHGRLVRKRREEHTHDHGGSWMPRFSLSG